MWGKDSHVKFPSSQYWNLPFALLVNIPVKATSF